MEQLVSQTQEKLDNVIKVLKNKLSSINASGAHPSLLQNIKIDYYETLTPLNQISNISALDATMLVITPFEPKFTKDICDVISKSNLGLNPIDDGNKIRLPIPSLTTEKRNTFVKDVKEIGEEHRILIRNIRQEANKKIRNNSQLSENEIELYENEIQKKIKDFNIKIEKIVKLKIEELLKI